MQKALFLGMAWVIGCGGGELVGEDTSSSTGGTTTGGSGGAANGGATSSGGGGESTTGGGGTGGDGGAGGSVALWPTCDQQEQGVLAKTLPEIWTDNPVTATRAWVSGVYVSAVSGGGCAANSACQIFVQQALSFADLNAAKRQSIRFAIAPSAASRFVGIVPGDRVDLDARAFRDTTDGRNELIFLVTDNLKGCMKKTGTGTLVPVTTTLDVLSVAEYEANGPIFIRIDTVSGKPNAPPQTFGMWDTGAPLPGDLTMVTSLSPFFLPNAQFTGLTTDVITDFASVTGVFGIFTPDAVPLVKYEELYPRSMTEVVLD
jgi:hypothetical protein